ncbi:MAG: DUF885 domain-containing protein [Bryobacterales bacterium]|nr:DUF885 domain-containing protein [Bryobacterales bacterium]
MYPIGTRLIRAHRIVVFSVLLLTLLGCGSREEGDGKRLHALFAREWEHRLQEGPLFATSVGDHRFNDKLPDYSLEAARRSHAFYEEIARDLEAIQADRLSDEDRVSYDVFRMEVQRNLDVYETGSYLMLVNADSGFHLYFARLAEEIPLATTKDYENYIARLHAFPALADGLIETMREGIRRGMTPPAITLQGFADTAAVHVVDDPETSALFQPFRRFPATVPAAEHERLRAEGHAAVAKSIVPGYRKLHRFFEDEYLPGCRQTLAAHALPGGEDFYAREVRYFTTLPLSPEAIHGMGLREVARIRTEMDAVMRQTGFRGNFADFVLFLREDPQFYAKTPEELLRRAAWICKRMDGKLPAFFNRLPRQPYTVEPVPDAIAPKYTAGRYVEAPRSGTRPGIYWVNTYALRTRSLFALEALTLHEAVPGHHLQIALAGEAEDLPPFRRSVYFPAFGEGWALYAERLGLEAGFYTDPYSDFGRLSYEMWRACRLVVDTGVHAQGWTRQQVIDYLAANTALSLHECTTETDRYISWPGQALAYKMGELKIRELRARAEQELGSRFDLRRFHDEILRNGSVPLSTLEAIMNRYIAREKSTGN